MNVTGAVQHSKCLDVFTIALFQACGGEGWYVSTTQLQLTSLQFCMACRSSTTLHLTVDNDTPHRLLACADSLSSSAALNLHCSARVPHFKARGVAWYRQSSAVLKSPVYCLTEAEFFIFDRDFHDTLDGVAWPRQLKRVEFGDDYDHEIEGSSFPPSLQQVSFGFNFNRAIEVVRWPASLLEMTLGFSFNQPIEGVTWPASLRQVAFGYRFNHPIEGASWPSSLEKISFGDRFDQPISAVAWPASLQQLKFGFAFNQPVNEVEWPASLKNLVFGCSFSQAVDGPKGPSSLEQLTVGRWFDQPLHGLRKWVPNLVELTLLIDRRCYHHPFDATAWPAGLQKLTIEKTFWDEFSARLPDGVELDVFYLRR